MPQIFVGWFSYVFEWLKLQFPEWVLYSFYQVHQQEGGTFQRILHSPTQGESSFLASSSHNSGLQYPWLRYFS